MNAGHEWNHVLDNKGPPELELKSGQKFPLSVIDGDLQLEYRAPNPLDWRRLGKPLVVTKQENTDPNDLKVKRIRFYLMGREGTTRVSSGNCSGSCSSVDTTSAML